MRFALAALLVPTLAVADAQTEARTGAAAITRAIKQRDAKTISAHLATPLTYQGVWFRDAGCKRFGAGGVLQTKDRDAFARCLSRVQLQMTTRVSAQREGVVITIAPGMELELVFSGESVRWLGPAGAALEDHAPMLTAQAFEALRTKGTTMLDDVVRGELSENATAWIKTCVDERGEVTRSVAQASSIATGDVFLRATADWAFRPFSAGAPLATCSLSLLTYPAGRAPSVEVLPRGVAPGLAVIDYQYEDDLEEMFMGGGGVIGGMGGGILPSIATIQAAELVSLSLRPLDPTPASAQLLAKTPKDWRSTMNVCIDTSGAVRNVVALSRRAGDVTRMSKIRRWKFKPYLQNGIANDACAVVEFVVTAP